MIMSVKALSYTHKFPDADDGIDDGDDSHYTSHVADELFAPIDDP
jgi:hypothetical protein